MMRRTWRNQLGLCLLLTLVAAPDVVRGQSQGSALLPTEVARRFGLERMWHSQIEAGRGQGRVNHITPFVSTTKTATYFEVASGKSRWVFGEHDRDQFGRELGEAGAERRANQQVELLKRQYPHAEEPKVEKKVIPEITLYCTTNRGVVHAIDGETGATRWVANLGNAAYPTSSAAASEKYVSYLNGSTLFVLDGADGTLLWQRRVSGVPGAGPAMSDEYVFAPMTNGAIESYSVSDYKENPWIYHAVGRAMVNPTYGLDTIVWPTDRGHVYVGGGSKRGIRYRLEASNPIVSELAFWPPNRFFATSVDGYVYCLNPTRLSGNINWRYSSGETINQSPIPCDDVVYAITDEDNLVCLGMKDGYLRWQTRGIKGFLASSKTRVYLLGEVGRVVIVDGKTGGRIGVVPLEEFDLHVSNPLTDRLYIGTKTGTIQCIREIGHTWPSIHLDTAERAKVKPKPKVIQQGLPGDGTAPPSKKPDAEEDPFATKPKGQQADDPFGGGAKPAAPKKDDAEDPFGAPAAGGAKPAPKPKDDNDPFG